MMKEKLQNWRRHWRMREGNQGGGLNILRHIGPGLLVTVGFIDPGNLPQGPLSAMRCFG